MRKRHFISALFFLSCFLLLGFGVTLGQEGDMMPFAPVKGLAGSGLLGYQVEGMSTWLEVKTRTLMGGGDPVGRDFDFDAGSNSYVHNHFLVKSCKEFSEGLMISYKTPNTSYQATSSVDAGGELFLMGTPASGSHRGFFVIYPNTAAYSSTKEDFRGKVTFEVKSGTETATFNINISFQVLKRPSAPVITVVEKGNVLSDSSVNKFCIGGAYTLSATPSEYEYEWVLDGEKVFHSSGLPVKESQLSLDLGGESSRVRDLHVTAYVSSCYSDLFGGKIEYVVPPKIENIVPLRDTAVCEGDTIPLRGSVTSGEDGLTAQWYEGGGAIGSLVTVNKDLTETVSLAHTAPLLASTGGESVTYTLKVDGQTCAAIEDSRVITVFDKPEAEIRVADEAALNLTTPYCVGSTGIKLEAFDLPSHGTAEWKIVSENAAIVPEGERNKHAVVHPNGDGAVEVLLTVRNNLTGASECAESDQKTFNVKRHIESVLIAPPPATENGVLCPTDDPQAQLTASVAPEGISPDNVTYTWEQSDNNGGTWHGVGTGASWAAEVGKRIYRVTADNGCTAPVQSEEVTLARLPMRTVALTSAMGAGTPTDPFVYCEAGGEVKAEFKPSLETGVDYSVSWDLAGEYAADAVLPIAQDKALANLRLNIPSGELSSEGVENLTVTLTNDQNACPVTSLASVKIVNNPEVSFWEVGCDNKLFVTVAPAEAAADIKLVEWVLPSQGDSSGIDPYVPLTKFGENLPATVTVTRSTAGCKSDSTTFAYDVYEKPTDLKLKLTEGDKRCEGDKSKVTATATFRVPNTGDVDAVKDVYQYELWVDDQQIIEVPSVSVSGKLITITYTTFDLPAGIAGVSGTPKVRFKLLHPQAECGVIDEKEATVTINPNPTVAITLTPKPVCVDQPVNVTVVATKSNGDKYALTDGSYRITMPDGIADVPLDRAIYTPAAVGDKVFTATFREHSTGCSGSGQVALMVVNKPKKPTLAVDPDGGKYCNAEVGVKIVVENSQQATPELPYKYTLAPDSTVMDGRDSPKVVFENVEGGSAPSYQEHYRVTADIEGYAGCAVQSDNVTVTELGVIEASSYDVTGGATHVCAYSAQSANEWENITFKVSGLQVADGASVPIEGIWVHVAPGMSDAEGEEMGTAWESPMLPGVAQKTVHPADYSAVPGLHRFYYRARFADGSDCGVKEFKDSEFVLEIDEPIAENEITFVGANENGVICHGASATLDGNAVPSVAAYEWKQNGDLRPETTEDLEITEAGIYARVAKRGVCELQSNDVVVSVNPEFVATTTGQSPRCTGESNGHIRIEIITPTTSPYRYDLGEGEKPLPVDGVISALPAATYNLLLKDNNNCSATLTPNSITLQAPDVLQIEVDGQPVYNKCKDGTEGSITFKWSGGNVNTALGWEYKVELLKDGMPIVGRTAEHLTATKYTFSDLSAGRYAARVTLGDGGCEVTSASVEITEPLDAPTIGQLWTVRPCKSGEANGQIWMQVSGGTAPYTFDYGVVEPSDTDPSKKVSKAGELVTVLTAGQGNTTYHILVKDANGCSVRATRLLTDAANEHATVVSIPATCFGAADGGVAIITEAGYALSGHSEVQAQLVQPSLSAPTWDGGGWVDYKGSRPNQLYIEGYSANTYNLWYRVKRSFVEPNSPVALTEYCVVQHDGAIVVKEPSDLGFQGASFVTLQNDAGCQGEMKGSIRIDSGAFSGNTTNEPQHFTMYFSIYETSRPEEEVRTFGPVSGFSGYPLNSMQFEPLFENLSRGEYEIKVKIKYSNATQKFDYISGRGGDFIETCEVVLSGGPYIIGNPNDFTLSFVDAAAPLCSYNSTGKATIRAVDGDGAAATEPYHWAISSYPVDSSAAPNAVVYSDLPEGDVTLTVSRGQCMRSIDVFVPQRPSAVVLTGVDVVHQNGCGDKGSLTVQGAEGGESPYTYEYGTSPDPASTFSPAPSGVASGLDSNTYYFKVTDKNNCSFVSGPYVVDSIAQPLLSVDAVIDETCVAESSVKIGLTGGMRPVTLLAKHQDGTEDSKILGEGVNEVEFIGLSAGNYTVSAQDALSCDAVGVTFTLAELLDIEASISEVSDDTLCPGDAVNPHTGSAKLTVSNQNGATTYQLYKGEDPVAPWSGTYTGSVIFTELAGGDYTVEIVDDKQCRPNPVASFTIDDVKSFSVNVSGIQYPSGAAAADGSFMATAVYDADGSSIPSATFSLSPNEGTLTPGSEPGQVTIAGLASGDYTVTATVSGCTASEDVELKIVELGPLTVEHPSCNGVLGSLVLTSISHAVSPVTIAWTKDGEPFDGVQVQDGGRKLVDLEAGVYEVTVTDGRTPPYVATATAVLDPYVVPEFSLAAAAPTCHGGNDGTISVTLENADEVRIDELTAWLLVKPKRNAAPFDPVNYSTWFYGLPADAYQVKIVDLKGCESLVKNEIVKHPAPVDFTYTLGNITCGGTGDVTLVELTGVDRENSVTTDVSFTVNDATLPVLDATVSQDAEGKWSSFAVNPVSVPQGGKVEFVFNYTIGTTDCTVTKEIELPCVKQEGAPLCNGEEAEISFTFEDDGVTDVTVLPDNMQIEVVDKKATATLKAGNYTLTWKEGGVEQTYAFEVKEPDPLVLTPTYADSSCGHGIYNFTVSGGTIGAVASSSYYKYTFHPLDREAAQAMPSNFAEYDGAAYVRNDFNMTFKNRSNNDADESVLYVYDDNGCEAMFDSKLTDPYNELLYQVVDGACPANAVDVPEENGPFVRVQYGKPVKVQLLHTDVMKGNFSYLKEREEMDLLSIIRPALGPDQSVYGHYKFTLSKWDGSCPLEREFELKSLSDPFTLALAAEGELQGKWCEDDYGYSGVIATVSGGNEPYTYDWTISVSGADPVAVVVDGNSKLTSSDLPGEQEFAYLKLGDYAVTVTDAKGCSYTSSASPLTLTSDVEEMKLTVLEIMDSFCHDPSGEGNRARIRVSGGEPIEDTHYLYYIGTNEFDVAAASSKIRVNTDTTISRFLEGVSTLHVVDGVGCYRFVDLGDVFSFPQPLALELVGVYDEVCHGDNSGMLHVEAKNVNERIRYILLDEDENVLESKEEGVFSGLSAGNYKAQFVDDNDCPSAVSGPWTIDSPSDITIADFSAVGTEPKCPGETLDLLYTTIFGGTGEIISYTWEVTAKGGGVTHVVTDDAYFPKAFPGAYTLTVVDEAGCMKSNASPFVVEGPEPYKLETVITKAHCMSLTAQGEASLGSLTISSITGGNSNPALSWLTPPPNMVDGTVDVGQTYNVPPGYYTLRLTDENQCEVLEDIAIGHEVDNQVTFNFDPFEVSKTNLFCYGTRVSGINLTITGDKKKEDTDREREWSVVHYPSKVGDARAGELIKHPSGYEIASPIFGLTKVSAAVYSTGGCMDTASFFLDVHPTLNLTLDRMNSRVGILHDGRSEDGLRDSIVLGVLAGVPSDLAFTVSNRQGSSYQYSFAPLNYFTDGTQPDRFTFVIPEGAESDPGNQSIIEKVTQNDRTYTFLGTKVTVTNEENSCAEDLRLWVRVVDELRIPNVFTPNGDGKNDRWLHNADPTYANVFSRLRDVLPDMEAEVFTRSGVRVWNARGEKISEGWDGNNGGAPLPVGTYYYVIRFNVEGGGKSWKPIAGSVTIVR